MQRTRKTTLLALAIASALGLTACVSDAPPDPNAPITLEFPSWQAEDPAFGAWWKEVIAEYESQHSDVTIDFYQVPFGSYVDQLTTRFAANDQPEIVHLPARNASEFASRGWLAPLNTRLEATDIAETWTPLQAEMNWQEGTYGVLLLGYGYTLYYNAELLESAGVAVPTTGEEVVKAAQAVTGGGVYGFGATTQQSPDNYTELMSFITGNGGSLAEGAEFTMETPAAIAGMEQYRAALREAPAGIQTQQRNELFLNGNIAMLLDGPFFVAELEGAADGVAGKLKTAAAPFETIPGGVSNSIHLPSGLDPRTEDAAWKFVELAASPEWQQRYTELAAVPAPRAGSITEEALEDRPELELFQELADEAVSIYPEDGQQKEEFTRLSQIVSEAAINLTTTETPTAEIARGLQEQLEREFGNAS
ncbi:ABC transporter substrate-binding protein [Pseudoclavibacter terrae]|uniref:ABC transporter substrate-binding protein n=1 Tax=Pseudoclavibacter terrae TaxID=1530195 RepID=UPI00232F5303|nr:sugar ABC transporter substrate-binding protein [Pseudoclavibacter terrae]